MSQIPQSPTAQKDESQQKQILSTPEKSKSNPLNDYKIINEIGSGSFGKVYKARKLSENTDKYYAIKRIKLQQLEQEMKNHQIFMEKLQIYFDFPGIPKMHSCFTYQGSIFFIMDFASGGPFEQFLRFNGIFIYHLHFYKIQFYQLQLYKIESEIKLQNIIKSISIKEKLTIKNNYQTNYLTLIFLSGNGSLTFKTIQFYTAEMVLILEYLHLQGLAHRDFKPENMVISSNRHLQLIDFGTLNDFCSNIVPDKLKMDIQKKNQIKIEIMKKKGILISDQEQYDEQEQINQQQSQKDNMIFKYDSAQIQNHLQNDDQSDFDNGIVYLASPLPVTRQRLTTFCGTNEQTIYNKLKQSQIP